MIPLLLATGGGGLVATALLAEPASEPEGPRTACLDGLIGWLIGARVAGLASPTPALLERGPCLRAIIDTRPRTVK